MNKKILSCCGWSLFVMNLTLLNKTSSKPNSLPLVKIKNFESGKFSSFIRKSLFFQNVFLYQKMVLQLFLKNVLRYWRALESTWTRQRKIKWRALIGSLQSSSASPMFKYGIDLMFFNGFFYRKSPPLKEKLCAQSKRLI